MSVKLNLYPLRLTLTAKEPIALDAHPGSALRGALFNALLRRFCMNPAATMCSECPLNATCPVAGLVAPLRDENPRGRDVPRPFVLVAEWATGENNPADPRKLTPGEPFNFCITLLGRAIAFFPYLALATRLMEMNGIGRPLRENGGRRGRFEVNCIDLVDPFGERTQRLYTKGATQVAAPEFAISPRDIAARAAALTTDRLTLHFLTPTRLIAEHKLVHSPDFRTLALRLAERVEAIECEYGEANEEDDTQYDWRERYQRIAGLASNVSLVDSDTRWVDVASYSARQGRATPIGGFVGRATFAGDISAELRELLVWGELLHVGKNTVKGDGLYRIQV